MRRITLFLKGNVDVYDSLHSCRLGGRVTWNGLNEVLRPQGVSARLKHETSTGAQALLEAGGDVPAELADFDPPLRAYPLESQFSARLFESDADAFILSVMPEIAARLVRHREKGFLFSPYEAAGWPAPLRERLAREFVEVPPSTVEQSMEALEGVVERLAARSDAPVLIYNLSCAAPGDFIHCHLGLEEAFSTVARRFNLGLIELSARTGVSIVDVDAVLARAGADRLKLDATHLAPEGCRLVAQEVARILADLGVLEEEDECARA